MSSTLTPTAAIWEQACRVRSRLSGRRWHQSFSAPVPLPSWLVDLVDGRMGTYVGPFPVLFRTSGIGLEWFTACDEHPELLEVTAGHDVLGMERLRAAANLLSDAGGVVDSDAYVSGDGRADGVFRVQVHRLFGSFSHATSARTVAGFRDELGEDFHVSAVPSRLGVTVQVVPRLVQAGEGA